MFTVPQESKSPYTFLSLFSGAGGLDIGFEKAGFLHTESSDILPYAVNTMRKNRPGWTTSKTGIRIAVLFKAPAVELEILERSEIDHAVRDLLFEAATLVNTDHAFITDIISNLNKYFPIILDGLIKNLEKILQSFK